jgi:hypothetical protein
LQEQETLKTKVETEQGRNRVNMEKIDKLWEDSITSITSSRLQKDEIAKLEERFTNRDDLLVKQQKTIDYILEKSQEAINAAKASEAQSRNEASAFARRMDAKFEDQERNIAAQEATHRTLINQVSMITNASTADAAKRASMQVQIDEHTVERDGLVSLTNKCYEMLTKQQVITSQQQELLSKLQSDLSERDETVRTQNHTIKQLREQHGEPDKKETTPADIPPNKRLHSQNELHNNSLNHGNDMKKTRR